MPPSVSTLANERGRLAFSGLGCEDRRSDLLRAYEGDDVRVLLGVPGVDRQSVREYFEREGLLDLFDAIDNAR